MTEDERYVQDRWKEVNLTESFLVLRDGNHIIAQFTHRGFKERAMLEARAFTESREREIAELEEEIEVEALNASRLTHPRYRTANKRTQKRLEAALADLRRGMKQAGIEKEEQDGRE